MTTETKTLSLVEFRAFVKANLGTPANNQNAATALVGSKVVCENSKGEFVIGTILATLSPKGKLQGELACSVEGCNETHVREASDFHQSMRCRTHATIAKAKLTLEEKAARRFAKAQAIVAAYQRELSVGEVSAQSGLVVCSVDG